MITGKDIYEVLSALVPLYVAMILAYGSVRWWKIFSPDQCFGINRFVSAFAIPLLSFRFISSSDPYAMNLRFIAADCLQKVAVLSALFLWHVLAETAGLAKASGGGGGGMDWSITLFSLSTLPNTLVMGVPLLRAMYGDFSTSLMIQIVVLQSILWYTLLVVLFECRAAMALVSSGQLPPDVASFEVEPDVVSLASKECLQTDHTNAGEDGKVRVVIRRSPTNNAIASTGFFDDLGLREVEIYSLPSSRGTTPRALDFEGANFYPLWSSRKAMSSRSECAPRLKEDEADRLRWIKGSGSKSGSGLRTDIEQYDANKKLHMFAWSTSSSSILEKVSDDFTTHQEETSRGGLGISTSGGSQVKEKLKKQHVTEAPLLALGTEATNKDEGMHGVVNRSMPPTSVMIRLIAVIVWRRLVRNPNTYASIIGLVWSLISFRWNVKLPKIVDGSISILSNTGLGMAMFSLGLFMALQPKIITCGKRLALFSMVFRFLVGPIVIAGTSAIVGIRGDLLRVSILQASLPQGIVPFVFAKDYDCHADILSTAVIFGMVVALPITIIYYVLLGLV